MLKLLFSLQIEALLISFRHGYDSFLLELALGSWVFEQFADIVGADLAALEKDILNLLQFITFIILFERQKWLGGVQLEFQKSGQSRQVCAIKRPVHFRFLLWKIVQLYTALVCIFCLGLHFYLIVVAIVCRAVLLIEYHIFEVRNVLKFV